MVPLKMIVYPVHQILDNSDQPVYVIKDTYLMKMTVFYNPPVPLDSQKIKTQKLVTKFV